MDTSWWLALAAVVVLALVVTLVDGWGRGARGARRRVRRSRGGGGPGVAEIWWARDPDPGGGERPFLVLAVRGDVVRVARIATKYHDERGGVVPLPPGAVGDVRGRASFVEPDVVRELGVGDFRRRVGVVDPVLWDQVRYLAG
ncbi:type II toxin-antitoxin system PemK/MazF family toxin [Streptomyces sp. NPDC059063]|uniref:type II toxin-antitoxin system PemK/MazF family toxin n=1 Tax=unclassified Streptomyces TaxID=2593676 RepID=UPI0036D1C410